MAFAIEENIIFCIVIYYTELIINLLTNKSAL